MIAASDLARRRDLAHATLVEIDLPSGAVNVWDGIGWLDHDGKSYRGAGRLGSVMLAASTTETRIDDLVLTLSGVDPDIAAGLDQSVKGGTVTLRKAFLDPGNRVLATVELVEAAADQMALEIGADGQAVIRLTARGGFYFLAAQSSAYWDRETQRQALIAAGEPADSDTGFDLMHGLKSKEVTWTRA